MYNLNVLLPFIDIALMDSSTSKTNITFTSKQFIESDDPKIVSKKLYESKVVFIHPDGFDFWSDVLSVLQEKKELPIKLFIFGGSDFFFDDEIMDYMTHLFPNSKFFISNYVGTNPNCIMLPLGSTSLYNNPIIKKCNFAIPNITLNCGYRHDFRKFIEREPTMKPFILPNLPTNVYFDVLANLRFATCPRGNGHDTCRFWECLMLKTIPIVERDIFYERLRETYPNLPFVMLHKWDDLPQSLDTILNEITYGNMLDYANFDVLSEEFWIKKVKDILEN